MKEFEVTWDEFVATTHGKIDGQSLTWFHTMPDQPAVKWFLSPHRQIAAVLMVQVLNKLPFGCPPTPDDLPEKRTYRYAVMVRESNDAFHMIKVSGWTEEKQTAIDNLIELVNDLLSQFDTAFIVGGKLDGRRAPFPEHDEYRHGHARSEIVERGGERLLKTTRWFYQFNTSSRKYELQKTDEQFVSADRQYEVIRLQCGTVCELRKNPGEPLESGDCQFRINGGSWFDFKAGGMADLREWLPTVTREQIEGGIEHAKQVMRDKFRGCGENGL